MVNTITFWNNPDRMAELVRIISILSERKAINDVEAYTPRKKRGVPGKAVPRYAVPEGGLFIPVVHERAVFQALQGET